MVLAIRDVRFTTGLALQLSLSPPVMRENKEAFWPGGREAFPFKGGKPGDLSGERSLLCVVLAKKIPGDGNWRGVQGLISGTEKFAYKWKMMGFLLSQIFNVISIKQRPMFPSHLKNIHYLRERGTWRVVSSRQVATICATSSRASLPSSKNTRTIFTCIITDCSVSAVRGTGWTSLSLYFLSSPRVASISFTRNHVAWQVV